MNDPEKRVFIADDDADDTQLFSEALAAVDPSIICLVAGNGEELLELLNTTKTLPELIFLDLNMPIMNGWDCLTEIKKSPLYGDVPVFIYSTSTAKSHIKQAFKLGASGFISKPYEFTDIQRILTDLFTKVTLHRMHTDWPAIEGIIFHCATD